MSQGSANGTHPERLELCSPSNNIGQVHPYNSQSVINIVNMFQGKAYHM